MKNKMKLLGAICIATSLNAASTDTFAIVNGEVISKAQVITSLKNQNIDYRKLNPQQKTQVEQKIINQKLLSQYALKSDVTKDPVYIDTLNKVKENIALQVFLRNLSNKINVKQSAIKEFYDKNQKLFIQPVQMKAKHILVKTKQEAQELINKLKKASNLKDTFASLAKEQSTGPSAKDGGDLGWFSANKMVPEFAKAVSSLNIDSFTTTPVKTKFGYHVIYLEDKKNNIVSKLDNVKNEIKQELLKNKLVSKIQKLTSDLKDKAKIQYK